MRVGFIGLGSMGLPMAANLARAGFQLTVYNRSPEKADVLIELGASRAASPLEASAGEAVITMLANDAALESVAFGDNGIMAALPKGGIHISMSTISVALAERLTHAHREQGQHFVSAPVFGRPDAAAAAKLFIAAAGEADAIERCRPLFDAMGQRTFVFGQDAARANVVKLSGNFLIAAVIESLGEAFALVGKAGIDQQAFLELLTSTLFSAPVYKTYGGLIASEAYEPPGFKAELGFKDVGLVLEAARDMKAPMPLASLISDRFLSLIAAGGGSLDWSALGKLARRDAGDAAPLAPNG